MPSDSDIHDMLFGEVVYWKMLRSGAATWSAVLAWSDWQASLSVWTRATFSSFQDTSTFQSQQTWGFAMGCEAELQYY